MTLLGCIAKAGLAVSRVGGIPKVLPVCADEPLQRWNSRSVAGGQPGPATRGPPSPACPTHGLRSCQAGRTLNPNLRRNQP